VLRTLFDLAAVVDFETLERAVECALRRRLVSFRQLEWRCNELAKRGRNGSAQMRKLLKLRGNVAPTGSDLETRFFQLLRRHGIRLPERQVEVTRRNGRKAYIDFAYPDLMIAIELEGDTAHPYLRRPYDRARQNELVLLGWTVLRFGWDEVVHDPESVITALRDALAGVRA
jgi:very-short-patch-repair endonuclease